MESSNKNLNPVQISFTSYRTCKVKGYGFTAEVSVCGDGSVFGEIRAQAFYGSPHVIKILNKKDFLVLKELFNTIEV